MDLIYFEHIFKSHFNTCVFGIHYQIQAYHVLTTQMEVCDYWYILLVVTSSHCQYAQGVRTDST